MTTTRFSPTHAAEDAELVSQARSGDESAFGDLYRRYARVVHGLLLARIPRADVDDLVQDASVAPPPEGVSRELALAGDPTALGLWWDALGVETGTWWRFFKKKW